MTEGTKRCGECTKVKALTEFYSRTGRPGQYLSQCKACRSQYAKREYAKPEKRWRAYILHLRRKYNLSEQAYNEMLASQNGRCALCPVVFSEASPPNVDHCHKTGRVRGLLCHACNIALGHIETRPFTWDDVANYVSSNQY